MTRQKWIIFSVALALMAGTAGVLVRLKDHPRLGQPGIKAEPIPGDVTKKIDLPEHVLDFSSTNVPESEIVQGYLPKDSSYAGRIYTAPDGFWMQATIILMGADRTSIHNADFCLRGSGLNPNEKKIVNIPIGGTTPYQLPVSVWKVSGDIPQPGGQKVKVNGVYVFWFVADNQQTPGHFQMMKRLAVNLLRTGVMQRWAYVSYLSVCAPGQEDAAFARMEKLIAASVPEFQPPPAGR